LGGNRCEEVGVATGGDSFGFVCSFTGFLGSAHACALPFKRISTVLKKRIFDGI